MLPNSLLHGRLRASRCAGAPILNHPCGPSGHRCAGFVVAPMGACRWAGSGFWAPGYESVTSGEPFIFHRLPVVLLLAESPERESFRGFVVRGLSQTVWRVPG